MRTGTLRTVRERLNACYIYLEALYTFLGLLLYDGSEPLIICRYHLIAASERKKGAVSCFDRHVMENMKLIDATCTPTSNPAATCTYELVIDGSYANLNNVMVIHLFSSTLTC